MRYLLPLSFLLLGSCFTRESVDDTVANESDTDTDTDTDVDDCSALNVWVVYACYCGECTASDIQCVSTTWAAANPCLLQCPVAECPALDTTVCACDEAHGTCDKK